MIGSIRSLRDDELQFFPRTLITRSQMTYQNIKTGKLATKEIFVEDYIIQLIRRSQYQNAKRFMKGKS